MGHKSLKDFRQHIDSTERLLWLAFEQLYGLPVGRLEAAIAIAGSAICGSNGTKVEPQKLIPKFGEPKQDNRPFVAALRAIANVMNK
jgi:hypothetical protein